MPDDDDALQDEGDSPVIRDLRAKAKRADGAESEAAALRTEVAVLRAGLTNLSDTRTKALLAAHEGDMDPESIRKTAIDLGFIAEDTTTPPPQVPADEQAAHERVAETTATAEAAEAKVVTLDERIANAKNEAELNQIMAEAGMLGISD